MTGLSQVCRQTIATNHDVIIESTCQPWHASRITPTATLRPSKSTYPRSCWRCDDHDVRLSIWVWVKNQTQPSKIVGKWVPNGTLVKMSSNSSNKFNRAASLSVILSWHPIVPIKKNQQNGQHVGIWMDNFFFSGHKFLQFATWCDAYE